MVLRKTTTLERMNLWDLCALLDCEPYICGNVGSGTVQEMQAWVEYLTFDGVSPMAEKRRANGRQEPWSIKFWGGWQ